MHVADKAAACTMKFMDMLPELRMNAQLCTTAAADNSSPTPSHILAWGSTKHNADCKHGMSFARTLDAAAVPLYRGDERLKDRLCDAAAAPAHIKVLLMRQRCKQEDTILLE